LELKALGAKIKGVIKTAAVVTFLFYQRYAIVTASTDKSGGTDPSKKKH